MDKQLFGMIQQEFDRLKKNYGIGDAQLREEDIENILGISVDELEKEYMENSNKHILQIESIHQDSVIPKYAFDSDKYLFYFLFVDLITFKGLQSSKLHLSK